MRALGAGDEIADYRIEALAGRGGMGVVYRNITIPQIMMVYELASTYYGWKFGIDPSSEFPSVCK